LIYLRFQHVAAFNKDITGSTQIRDAGIIESACMRPQTTIFGEDAYLTIWDKAAALLQSLACNHGFVDGNKRTAWMAVTAFLEVNGHPFDQGLDRIAARELVLAIAEGAVTDIPAIASELVKFAH
jgi:death on curing protein